MQESFEPGAQVLVRSPDADPSALSYERWEGLGPSDGSVGCFKHNGDFTSMVGEVRGNAGIDFSTRFSCDMADETYS